MPDQFRPGPGAVARGGHGPASAAAIFTQLEHAELDRHGDCGHPGRQRDRDSLRLAA